MLSLDLHSGRIRRLAPALEIETSSYWTFPLATAGNNWVLLDVPAGNLHAIIGIPRNGSAEVQRLITVTGRPLGLDISRDGSVYIDQVEQSTEVFSYSPESGSLERMPVPAVNDYAPRVPLDAGIEEPIVLKSSVRLSGGVNLAPTLSRPTAGSSIASLPQIHGSGPRQS